MDDVVFAPAHRLATQVRQREISATEVLAAHLAHIVRHNPRLNAIVTLDEPGAQARAVEADAALARGEVWGPLHDVPITVKDALTTAGLRTTSGHPSLVDYVPPVDATVVARMRASGAVVLGKTNLPPLRSASRQTIRSSAVPSIHGTRRGPRAARAAEGRPPSLRA